MDFDIKCSSSLASIDNLLRRAALFNVDVIIDLDIDFELVDLDIVGVRVSLMFGKTRFLFQFNHIIMTDHKLRTS